MTRRSILRARRTRLRRHQRLAARFAVVLASLAAGTSLAHAQDASWLSSTATPSFNTGTNWSSGSVPTETATFGASSTTNITLGTGPVSVGTLQFSAGAPAYNFTGTRNVTLSGQGIVDNASNAPSIGLTGATLAFTNSASAGDATLTSTNGTISFANTASGGTARIVLNSSGNLDISGLTSGGTTVGSVEGAGNVVLGRNQLTTGINGASTTLSGIVSGSGGSLVKARTGTTILTGNNSYAGTTTISSGTLQIGNGGTAGTLGTGGIAVASGATLAFNRSDNVTITNAIGGSGGVSQVGNNTVTLMANNTYTGVTTISGGTLSIGSNGTSGSIAGDVIDNGTLRLARSNSYIYAGSISGSGNLTMAGSGTTTLTGNNTYSGTTTISAGTLQIGNGSASGSLGTGDVTDNGTLTFNRSDSVVVANVLSGSGKLVQAGQGTTVLTGANSYAGTTTISAGTLQVGNGGTSGSLGSGSVTNNGALMFNRSDAITVANVISGSGSLLQAGVGTTILTGNNGYTGTTTISGGTLQVGNGGTSGNGELRGRAGAEFHGLRGAA